MSQLRNHYALFRDYDTTIDSNPENPHYADLTIIADAEGNFGASSPVRGESTLYPGWVITGRWVDDPVHPSLSFHNLPLYLAPGETPEHVDGYFFSSTHLIVIPELRVDGTSVPAVAAMYGDYQHVIVHSGANDEGLPWFEPVFSGHWAAFEGLTF
jgi:hypothetical protein